MLDFIVIGICLITPVDMTQKSVLVSTENIVSVFGFNYKNIIHTFHLVFDKNNITEFLIIDK